MKLGRVTPRFGGLSELRSFECRPCSVVVTEAVEDTSDATQHTISKRPNSFHERQAGSVNIRPPRLTLKGENDELFDPDGSSGP